MSDISSDLVGEQVEVLGLRLDRRVWRSVWRDWMEVSIWVVDVSMRVGNGSEALGGWSVSFGEKCSYLATKLYTFCMKAVTICSRPASWAL